MFFGGGFYVCGKLFRLLLFKEFSNFSRWGVLGISDRVFGERCNAKQVYEQGIKEVALSVLRASIFAYGQTSSGKTRTMSGITEYAHKDREFVIKFSAMEIYNEAVRDLLNAGATSLRILDDPEKWTVVEKLTEDTLTERRQLQQLPLLFGS
ncbi:Kinesin heavy chain isoform 5C [Glycine soja]|uniref:Kinesin heavy chain isoform 5C n=1 Tax=Glycine soja TaxID=3848 RepID=A0A0B2PI99_GLYSO|nr:Kinesin heavy chain isoform 5C [Glycine soja]